MHLGPPSAPDPRAVLAAFGLAGEVTSYAEVAGGWSNRVLRLRTTGGDYAVKELRNAWGEPRWIDWLAEAWRLELAARDVGVRAPEPVPSPEGACVAQVERGDGTGAVPVRLHRWVEARTVAREPVDLHLASWVGSVIAAQHALALRPRDAGLYAGRTGLTTAAVWPDLVSRSRSAGAPWADDLDRAEPLARRASALLVDDASSTGGSADAVLVHGDVDQKNLLLAPDGPLLLDWDVVVPAVPAHDLANAAVTMAGWRDPAVAAAVVHGYVTGGGATTPPNPSDLGPALASRLGWIRFTVDRAIDAHARDGSWPEPAPGVAALLTDLERRVVLAESWPRWLGDQ